MSDVQFAGSRALGFGGLELVFSIIFIFFFLGGGAGAASK